ncbi:MAG: dihydroorotase [Desulfobacterales bacterium C00003106]|jgi:dihydroorotase|nr:MAG: dihydroorotase [Desulfobacterales bacterium C00003106]
MRLIIRGGRVIDPASNTDAIKNVVIENGRIVRLQSGAETRNPDSEIIDASGMWVVPGLIDMHTHLREPGHEYKETIATGCAAAAAGGFTSICCMPNTTPVNDNQSVTDYILKKAREAEHARVYPVGAISKGLQGRSLAEFGELKEAGVVAVSDDGNPVMNSQLMRRALEYTRAFDLFVISHCEDLDLAGSGVMNEGTVATRLGLRGIPNAVESVMVSRDLMLAELTGAKLHIAHVSAADSVRCIRDAKKRGVLVTAETAPHYFSLTEAALLDYNTNAKMNPPLRTKKDVEAICEGLRDGSIDAIATDHAPHSILEKDIEFDAAANGIIGMETSLPLSLKLVRNGILDPMTLIAKMSTNPARIIGLPAGQLKPGASADVTVIDPEVSFTVDANSFKSKARNCPFDGWNLQGKAALTIVEGRIIHRSPPFDLG